MRNFQEFMFLAEAAYDASVMGSSQIRRIGDGGKIGAERKKSAPEIRRVRAVGGGKTEPVQYKPRKDIGTQRGSQTQAPTQERGSAREAQLAAAKEERRKAALARRSASASTSTEKKPTERDLTKQASKLLSKKEPAKAAKPTTTPRRNWKSETGAPMTRAERDRARNKERGESLKVKKAELIKDFTEKHGRAPKGSERTKLLGLAHGAAKAGV